MTFINSYQKNGSNMAFGSVTAVTTNESGYFMIESPSLPSLNVKI